MKARTKTGIRLHYLQSLILVALFQIVTVIPSLAQDNCDDDFFNIDFGDEFCINRLSIDTINIEHNSWQIGQVEKAGFNNCVIHSSAIITDTLNPYPVNDSSYFEIKTLVTHGVFFGCKSLSGSYYVDTDTLNDFGKIELSVDMGATWINLLDEAYYGSLIIWYQKPVFTGTSNGCAYFDALLGDMASQFELSMGDTLIFRFTFISDEVFDNRGGLMLTRFNFNDFVEGISDTRFIPIKSTLSPNPACNTISIDFENPDNNLFELAIYTIDSRLVLTQQNIRGTHIEANVSDFRNGQYIFKLTDPKNNRRSWGKFIKN